MTDNTVTDDLSDFGTRELWEAGHLLQCYAENCPDFLTDGVKVWFNRNSGYVFLSDEDFNVAVIEDWQEDGEGNRLKPLGLVQFFSCPECGEEGTDGFNDSSHMCEACHEAEEKEATA